MDQLNLIDALSQYIAVTSVICMAPPLAIWIGMQLMRVLGFFGWVNIPFKREDVDL